MFTYEFVCPNHGRFEQMCRTNVKVTECPTCGETCDKVPSAPAFILKGEGWTKKGVK
jgi:putative FmdB family regulatory protein